MGLSPYICGFAGENMVKCDTFLHLMHLPTLFIILFFFRYRLFFLLRSFFGSLRKKVVIIIAKIICLTALADIITVFFFMLFKLFPPPLPLGIGLIITALILYSLRWVTPSNTIWNWQYAIILGTVQGIALLPGISRFAAVYACACWLGLPQRKAFEITWLVQWPLILAACVESIYLLWISDQLMPLLTIYVINDKYCYLFGLLMFYLAAYLAREGKLWWFSFYMVVPIIGWLYLCFVI